MPHLPHPIKHHHEKKEANENPNLLSKDDSNDLEQINTDYKGKLDEMAVKAREQHNGNGSGSGDGAGNGSGSDSYMNAAIETVSQYVPALGKMLGKEDTPQESTTAPQTSIPGPPERPDHDVQIEEFVRDQHRSKKEDGQME